MAEVLWATSGSLPRANTTSVIIPSGEWTIASDGQGIVSNHASLNGFLRIAEIAPEGFMGIMMRAFTTTSGGGELEHSAIFFPWGGSDTAILTKGDDTYDSVRRILSFTQQDQNVSIKYAYDTNDNSVLSIIGNDNLLPVTAFIKLFGVNAVGTGDDGGGTTSSTTPEYLRIQGDEVQIDFNFAFSTTQTVSPTLPLGLNLTRNRDGDAAITGIPSAITPKRRYTVSGENYAFLLSITEAERPVIEGDDFEFSFGNGIAINPILLPEATGGYGDIAYRLEGVSGELFNGLAFDPDTRTLFGIPDITTQAAPIAITAIDRTTEDFTAVETEVDDTPFVEATRTFRYIATDENANESSKIITITILEHPEITFIEGDVETEWKIGQANMLALPQATGGDSSTPVNPIRYEHNIIENYEVDFSPSDPIAINLDTLILTGTPVSQNTVTSILEATDAAEQFTDLTITIELVEYLTATFPELDEYEVEVDDDVDITLPEALPDEVYFYTIRDLPRGLDFDNDKRKITGTVIEGTEGTYNVSYIAANYAGVEAETTFALTVV